MPFHCLYNVVGFGGFSNPLFIPSLSAQRRISAMNAQMVDACISFLVDTGLHLLLHVVGKTSFSYIFTCKIDLATMTTDICTWIKI